MIVSNQQLTSAIGNWHQLQPDATADLAHAIETSLQRKGHAVCPTMSNMECHTSALAMSNFECHTWDVAIVNVIHVKLLL